MRAFPDRPVTSKPSEVRMGKGKGEFWASVNVSSISYFNSKKHVIGYVDFYATWLAEGRMVFEVKGTRPELAIKALKVSQANICQVLKPIN